MTSLLVQRPCGEDMRHPHFPQNKATQGGDHPKCPMSSWGNEDSCPLKCLASFCFFLQNDPKEVCHLVKCGSTQVWVHPPYRQRLRLSTFPPEIPPPCNAEDCISNEIAASPASCNSKPIRREPSLQPLFFQVGEALHSPSEAFPSVAGRQCRPERARAGGAKSWCFSVAESNVSASSHSEGARILRCQQSWELLP